MLSLQHHILPSSYPENANGSNTCGPLKIRFRSTTETVVLLTSTIIMNGHRLGGVMRRAIRLALALAPGIDGINASPWSMISWRVAVGYWDS